MNDERHNQLCAQWTIPEYARERLWVATEFESVRAEGPHGSFTLSVPAPSVIVRWGSADGAGLAKLRWRPDALNWMGEVRVGGSVDAMHFFGLDDEYSPQALVVLSGQPLHPMSPYLLGATPQPHSDFFAGVDQEEPVRVTRWLIDTESDAYSLLRDAMLNKLNVYAWGRLVDMPPTDAELLSPFELLELTLFAT
jgi:hypothetical protein